MKKQILKSSTVLLLAAFVSFAFLACKKDLISKTTGKQGHSNLSLSPNQSLRIAQTDYQYLLGVEPIEGPNKAVASNDDTITLAGSGTFSINPKSVTGEGWFKHTNAAGVILGSGTWNAIQLISFHSYGNSFPVFPENFEGGLALIRIHLSPDAGGPGIDGVLQVDCLIGNPPTGAKEGIRLNVQGINFNKEVHGETVFIRL